MSNLDLQLSSVFNLQNSKCLHLYEHAIIHIHRFSSCGVLNFSELHGINGKYSKMKIYVQFVT